MWLYCRELPKPLRASRSFDHHHVFKLPIVKRGFGKDKRKRLGQCPSPQPPQEQGATSPCPASFASKGSCTWMTWGAEGGWWLRYHQHKRDSLPPPPLPPYFPHQPSLLPFILYQAVINPAKELMYFNTK